MRVVKIEVVALSLLLIAFLTTGAVLIRQESLPAKNATTFQNGFSLYLYQDLSAVEQQNTSLTEEKTAKSQPSSVGLVLWLLGLPLGTLGGLAMGLTISSRTNGTVTRRLQPTQIVLSNRPEAEITVVSNGPLAATQQDISALAPERGAMTNQTCRRRFHRVTPSPRRENQPR